MFNSYEESVLDAANCHTGCLSERLAERLLNDHGFTLEDVLNDSNGEPAYKLAQHHAQTLLNWLGY
jgi:hypothetical protein